MKNPTKDYFFNHVLDSVQSRFRKKRFALQFDDELLEIYK